MSDVKRTDEIQGEILHVYDDIEEADNNRTEAARRLGIATKTIYNKLKAYGLD